MKARIAVLLSAASLIMTACGGGGDSSTNNKKAPENPEMDGIYFGQGFEENFGSFEFITFVQDGQLIAISDTGVGYRGALTINDAQNTYTTRLRLYDFDGSRFDDATTQGTFISRNSFTGSYSRTSGFSGDFRAAYAAEAYEQPSSIEKVAGIWSSTNTIASNSVTINANGEVFGTDSDGCIYSGEISTPNTSRNLYKVSFRIENCEAVNGSYFGLAATGQSPQGDWLTLLAGNEKYGFAFDFAK